MATSTEHPGGPARPSIPKTPLFAVVGVTELAVQQVRAAAAGASSLQQQFRSDVEARLAQVERRVGALDPKSLKAQAEQAPTRAVARALEVAVKAEAAYEELARRGKDLVDRVYPQGETQTFREQAAGTLNRGGHLGAAVTVARRAADDTASAIRGRVPLGRTEAGPSQPATPLNLEAVQEAVAVGDGGNKAPKPTRAPARPAAKKAAVRKTPNASKPAVKATGTSARKAPGARAAKKADED
jgi:hypothetical protein